MVKKWGCFSAVKRVFLPHSSKKLPIDSVKKGTKGKKKKGLGIFKGPSSVEKIFWDFEREQQSIVAKPLITTEQLPPPNLPFPEPVSSQPSPPNVISESISSQPPVNPPVSAEAASLRAASPEREEEAPSSLLLEVSSPKPPSPEDVCRPESNLIDQDVAATKIQAAYRGYRARWSYRAQKGLERLRGLVKGQSVKQQTVNAMKQMKLLVRIQSQLHSQRVQFLVNQPQYHQTQYKDDKEVQSSLTKSSMASGVGEDEDWDGSVITKEELDARLRRKAEAAMGRERATIYAYSHQLGKVTSKSSQAAAMDFLSGGFPWGWSWLERQLSQENSTLEIAIPPSPTSHAKKTPISRFQPSSNCHHDFGTDNADSLTPESTKSSIFSTPKPVRTSPFVRTPLSNSSKLSRFPRPRVIESPFDVPSIDNESLTSCPAFSVPRYMAMTASSKSKVRSRSNPKARFPATPSSEVSRRLSYPFTPAIGSSNENNAASFFSPKSSSSQSVFNKNRFLDNQSVHSMVSLPAGVGRKPFNRFV